MTESFRNRDWHGEDSARELPSNRSVGIAWGIFFFIIAALPLLKGHPIRPVPAIIGGSFVVSGLFVPVALKPFNLLVMKLTLLLNKITSPIAMGLIYGLAVVPTGFLMRMFGADLLGLRMAPGKSSYWVIRPEEQRKPKNFDKQF